jgi:hypothetical protein
MSISKEERLSNLRLALTLFVEQLGDEYYKKSLIGRNDKDFDRIFSTTWQELIDKGYLRSVANGFFLELTAMGWREGLKLAGKLEDTVFIASLGRISKALKDRVKGREQGDLVIVQEIADTAQVPIGLVRSVIDSKLLMHRFNQVTAKWANSQDDWHLIEVPTNFGLDLI